ncbi:AAA family ATPase [Xanthobacter sp. V0B-10]|uniref:AAA family ATPase n=3 Tax=Xanthobacter albus TaxID=3119929 RepID=UPI00372739B5
MRFLSLGLDRYGHFTDRRLDFDPAARVVVVLGANEAGKTTALAAACDVLFGIEERSRFSFLHDYKSMRLSATIAGADGRPLSFARLKRRQATLVDPQTDAPLPDDMLVPFLGAHDRDAFLAIFGLDQARLREGGAKLLAGGGDLADTLVAAAPGLGRVAALRDEMKAEAAALFNPARAVAALPFYAAVTRYKEADKVRQDSELRGEAVARLRADAEEAARACAEARDAEEAALRAANRARALLGAARELRAIAAAEAARAALGPLPEVDAAFPAQARARLDARNRAAEAAAQAAQAAEQAGAARAAVTVDDAVLARADDIARRDEERAQVENKLASLPNRRREADAARVGLARIAAGLDLPDVEALRARLPGRPLLARAGTLADGLRAHAARREALEADALSLARRRRDTDSEELPPVADPAPLRRRLEALDGAETRASAAETQGRRLAAAREALAARVARLPFGPWRADDLLRRPLPDHEVAEAALARVADAETAHARADEQREDLAAQRNQIQARRRVLDGAGTAPTASAIAAAREARDARWRALRPVLLAQRAVLPGDTAEAETFERALAAADRLSDERQTESRRLADLARAELDLAELDARLATAEARVAAAQASLDAAREAWRALWSASGLPAEEASLPVLSDVESIRRDADALLAQQAETTQQVEAARRDRAEAEALRADLHLPPLGEAPLRMAELRAAVAALETAFQRQRELRRDRERHVRDAAELDARRSTLDTERDALAAEAAEVFPALAIRPGATADEARAALGLWQEAATLHGELATAERRIAGIEQDERAFTQRMEELLGQLEEAASGDLFATVRALRRRVEAALQARTRAEAAQALLAERDAAGDAARATLERADAGLAEVLARAGVTQPAELPAQLERLEQAARCDGEIAAARQRLDSLRGGRAVEEIRDEIGGRDDEALARHAEDAAAAHDAARQARDAAIVADTRAQEEQKAQAGQAGAAGAAQDMQDAIADLGDAMERFTRAHVAARLLAFAVERYRERHQNPIVTRAAEAFATLTDGRWSGIGIDYDKDPPRLAAIRDGRLHGVDALSEGTADQLFLALRVAAIEEHARRATPLPFLADDLFVSFDEGRTEAGMRLLAGLGAVTQVIVFTHHAHVAECATRALGREASVIPL